MCEIIIPQLENQEECQFLQERDLCNDGPITVYYFIDADENKLKEEIENKYDNVIFLDFCTTGREDLTLQLLQSLLIKPSYVSGNTFFELKKRFNSIIDSQDHGIDVQYDQLFCDLLSGINAYGKDVFIYLGNRALIEWGNTKDRQRFKKINNIENDRLHFVIFTKDKGNVERWNTNVIHDFSTLIRMDTDKVYFSYNWEKESNNIVDAVQKALTQERIITVRDKKDCHYRDSIRKFENEIGKAKKVIIVFSKEYLQSLSCMYEMNRIIACGNIEERIFPIVTFNLSNDKLNGIMIETQQYWNKQSENIVALKEQLVPGTREIILDQEFVINETLKNFTIVWGYLRDTCSKTLSQLLENDCALLVEALRKI